MMKINEKLELAIRQNKGLIELNKLKEKFLEIGVPLGESNFYSLEETDLWWKNFKDKQKLSSIDKKDWFEKAFAEYDTNSLRADINSLTNRLGNLEVILFIKQSEFCGAIKLDAKTILNNYEFLIHKIDEDTLNFGTLNHSDGFMLDFVEGVKADKFQVFYSLQVWGKNFSSIYK